MPLQIGIVKNIKGVGIKVSINDKEQILKTGDIINAGDSINTLGENSKITLILNNKEEINIGGNDTIVLDKSVYGDEELITNISKDIIDLDNLNNLEPTSAGDKISQLGINGEAIYQNGGNESNINSYLLNKNENNNIQIDNFNNSNNNNNNNMNYNNEKPITIDDYNIAIEEGFSLNENEYISTKPAIGNILNNDFDLNDIHSQLKVINVNGISTENHNLIIGNYGTLLIHSNGDYTYTVNNLNNTVNSLSKNEILKENFIYTISDNNSVNPKINTGNLEIKIIGSNDAPILFPDNNINNITEDSQLSILHENGKLFFTDVDLNDNHIVNVINNDNNIGQLTATIKENFYSNHGEVLWNYKIDNSKIEYLGVGETKEETFNVIIKDNNGDISSQTISITIIGTNDAPIAVSSNGSFYENQLSESIIPVIGNENLLTGVIDKDISDINHYVSKISIDNVNYENVNENGNFIKVSFDYINANGNHENIFIPVKIYQDGSYVVSQNELLDNIPKDVDAIGKFYYKIDDGHNNNHLSESKEFTINIHGQNDAPEINIIHLNNNSNDDIPVIIKISGDRFNENNQDAPKFNIIVDGHKINNNPLTVEEFRSYNIDSNLGGSEQNKTSWEYITFNIDKNTKNISIQYINDAWEGGHDKDNDGYSEDRNLIIDFLNIGGKIITDNNNNISVIGGNTLEAEDLNVSTYTVHNGVDKSGRETMAWAGTMDFDISNSIPHNNSDIFHSESITENYITDNNILGNVNLLDGAIDKDGLKSDMKIVQINGENFSNVITVTLNENDINGNPLTLDLKINSNGTYFILENNLLNTLSAGTVAEGSFNFKIKDIHNDLSNEQIFTIKIIGTNDQPIIQDITINKILYSIENTKEDFSGIYSENGENSSTFGNEKISHIYHLGNEYAGKMVTINFDIKELGTWDGDGIWNKINEKNIEKLITFINDEKVNEKIMGLDNLDNNSDDGGVIISGQAGTHIQTDLHHFSIEAIADDNGDIKLGFGSTLHEGIFNEAYSINNILIISGKTIYENNNNLIYNGNLATVSDVDINDTHIYHLVNNSETIDNHNITDYNININENGNFTLSGNFSSLSEGETATISFQYTADDKKGFIGDEINESSISEPKTVTLTIIGTNEAPVIDLDGNNNNYKESFENLIDSQGWKVITEPAFVGDNGIIWHTKGGHNGLEVQYGKIGDSLASDGKVHAELDSDQIVTLSTNIYISDNNAELKFDYKPRPYHENDSNMKVQLGNIEFIIHSDGTITNNSGNFEISTTFNETTHWMTVTVNTDSLIEENNTTLKFTGLGDSDSFGAYLDNISLINNSNTNNYNTSYIENGNAINIVDNDINISDVDGNSIDNLIITLTNKCEGDILHINNLPIGLTANYHNDSIVILGNSTISTYENIIKSITFENHSDTVNETNRTIEIVVNDGHNDSNTAISTIHVISSSNIGSSNNDIFSYDNSDYYIDGKNGIDTLLFQENTTINFNNIEDNSIKNIEIMDLTKSKVDILHLNSNDILDITDNNNILKINGDANDSIHTDSNWNNITNQSNVESGYNRYESIADDGITHVFVDIKDTIIQSDF